MWSLFEKHHISGSYYAGNLPVLGYWGRRHAARIKPMEAWYAQCEAGTLPQVSYIDPFFTLGEEFGNDDHPHADIRLGQAFLSDVVETFVNSRHYQQGALVVTYDEWGGFYDHVDPPRIADHHGTPKDPGGKNDFAQVGFRVPTTIVSPWTATPGAVDHTLNDHASVVRFIADNWGLPHLTKRVQSTNSIERAFRGFKTFDPEPRFTPYVAPLSVAVDAAVHALVDVAKDEVNDPTKLPAIGKIPGTPAWPVPPVFPPEPPPPAPKSANTAEPADGLVKMLEMGWFEKHKIRTDYKLENSFAKSRPALLKEANAPRP
ncbi:MAG: alkaline phosphatase family protein [Acidimicrobiales bacterium]|nr:alkaline phosphatase family protein [Acidimicrobiales bacterium]